MTYEPGAAVTSATINPVGAVNGHGRMAEDMATSQESRALSAVTSGGGAMLQPNVPATADPSSVMNLGALAGQFADGMQHGFYAHDIEHLMGKLALSHQPDSGVTIGDVSAELLNVQAKVGVADAFSKVSAKLSEGLQTLVVRQG
jgi:hypothetical protein